MLDSICATLGINKTAFASGFLGGVFSLRWVPQVGTVGIVSTVSCAALVANYATTPIYQKLAIAGLHEGGVGLMIGLFSMSFLAAIFKALEEMELKTVLTNLINRFTGGGRP